MLKEKHLRWILIITLLIAVALPLLNTLYIAPRFSAMMIQNVEIESKKVCSHIGREIVTDEYWRDWISQGLIPDFIAEDLDGITSDLGLIKIKFFQPDGTIIYSTDVAEIGKINRHEYFHSIVAKGKGYSKLVRKQTNSLEGQTYDIDVAETYVPVMRDGQFAGAFEFYHDVTGQIAQLNSLTMQASLVPAVVAALFVLMVVKTLQNLKVSMIEHRQAEADLTETLDAAWQLTESLEEKNNELQTINRVVEQAHIELQTTPLQMLHREKMATLGILTAEVAHEINNPVGYISCNLKTFGKYVDRFMEYFAAEAELLKEAQYAGLVTRLESERSRLKLGTMITDVSVLIAESLEGVERINAIVQNLKSFSRVDKTALKPSDINECLESAIKIVWSEINSKAELLRDLGELPPVTCSPQEINQVFINLLVNAAQSLENRGEIKVRTWAENDQVLVSIADNGCGMPPAVQAKIFEPFFTTKGDGTGTGLGMSISHEIVMKHGGEIKVDSVPGEGTTFLVRLPVNHSLADHENEQPALGVQAS
jgi:signal transduction histidine kinase